MNDALYRDITGLLFKLGDQVGAEDYPFSPSQLKESLTAALCGKFAPQEIFHESSGVRGWTSDEFVKYLEQRNVVVTPLAKRIISSHFFSGGNGRFQLVRIPTADFSIEEFTAEKLVNEMKLRRCQRPPADITLLLGAYFSDRSLTFPADVFHVVVCHHRILIDRCFYWLAIEKRGDQYCIDAMGARNDAKLDKQDVFLAVAPPAS